MIKKAIGKLIIRNFALLFDLSISNVVVFAWLIFLFLG